ncbi:MAG: HAMP domain-containing sensor histidine kinase [Candidatus Saccharibacteria bacterium]
MPKLSTEPTTSSYFSNWDRNLLSLTHELSGPLTAASLNLEKYLLASNPESLEMLKSNLKLMEDYLANTRQLIRRLPVPPRPFSVNKQLANIVRNLSPVASQSLVTIKLNVDEDCALRGNATRFKQIISCVIRNAIDSYDDCLRLNRYVVVEHHLIKDYLVVSIKDHGSGISKAYKSKIFKPYFSTKRGTSGLGLGLSLAAESITEDFMGYVKVESDKNNGTTFRLFFRLPKVDMLK